MGDLRDDIKRYGKGELSPAEMHALERKALTDPFLADALEGADSLPPEDFENDIADLERQLERRRRPAVSLWIWAGRIAAGLALVGLATFSILYWPDDNKLAEGNAEKAPDAERVADSVANSGPLAALEESSPTPRKRSAPRLPAIEAPAEETVEIPDDLFNDSDFLLPENEAKASRPARLIKGSVVDSEDGRPLPGVNVTLKGLFGGTITDEEGNFQIAVDSLNESLVFSYVGFESREVVPGAKNEVNVALEPDISELSEIVVVGYGTREPASADATTVEMAEPEGGKKAFKQYLAENLKYPEQALTNNVEGKVTIQFTIHPTGSISDFRVVKGLGYGCEEELIRLIQEGPKWQPTRRNHQPVSDKVKVRLKFSLPKKK